MGNDQSSASGAMSSGGNAHRRQKNKAEGCSMDTGMVDYKSFFTKHSPYKVLGVSESDSIEHILTRYRTLLKMYHPDKGGDIKKFHLVKEAFAQINLIHEENQFSHYQAKRSFQAQADLANYENRCMDSVDRESDGLQTCYSNNELYPGGSGQQGLEMHSARQPIEAKQQEGEGMRRAVGSVTGQTPGIGPVMGHPPGIGRMTGRDQRDFLEKFNRNFKESWLENENLNHGYANPDWEDYDKKEKKYEIISYEDIGFQASNEVYAEPLENKYVNDFSKYPSMSDKNLNYTDFKQAYTNRACLLPESHEKIWNDHFASYHDRDLKKVKNQREAKQQLTEEEMTRHRKRLDTEREAADLQTHEWKQWVDQQSLHYQSRSCIE